MAGLRGRQREQTERFFGRVGQLDRDSPVPLYYQLQGRLKEDIDAGHWQPGQYLPSESELEGHLGVSRTVIRKALDVLEADGQVKRQKGRGTSVVEPKLRYAVIPSAQEGWHEERLGAPVLSEIIDVRLVDAGGSLGSLLAIAPSDRLFEITTVGAVDQPISLTQSYVRCDASPELAALAASGAPLPLEVGGHDVLNQLAAQCGLHVHRTELSIEATTANEFEAKVLRIPDRSPMFLLSTLVSGVLGTNLALLRSVIRSDHFRFTATVVHAGADVTGTRIR